MLYSELFPKSDKNFKDNDSKNATLLVKAGYIDKTSAGVYKLLPLGLRVLRKIENIIREEMDKLGQEMLLTSLSPKDLYKRTGRDNIDTLFIARSNDSSRGDQEYFLNLTLEDNITPMVKKFIRSYKDLPLGLYQIQVKFRNEKRVKSGLLRCREFIMKDLYSFHVDKKDLEEYYDRVKESYIRIFNRLGIGEYTYVVLASGGDFTQNYTHEFQLRSDVGEDWIFRNAEGICYNREVAPCRAPMSDGIDDEFKPIKKIETVGMKTVDQLATLLNIDKNMCVKTMIYSTEKGLVAVAVRGDYEINEIKLRKLLGVRRLQLATDEEVYNATGAEVGYAGILNLKPGVELICDDSIENLVNFECGANETNYHFINVNWGRDVNKPDRFYDVKVAKIGDIDPITGIEYEVFRGIEIGNIFQLDTKFSKDFDLKYLDRFGKENYVYMGSYGIGVTRLIGAIAEVFSDDNGLVWPKQVSPFSYHIVSLATSENDYAYKKSHELYKRMCDSGIEVLWDDRLDVSFGEKLKDADLMGIPSIVVVGKKSVDNVIELKSRLDGSVRFVGLDYFYNHIFV